MANSLSRFDPYSALARLDPFRGLEEVFDQSPRLRSAGMTPRMDVRETAQGYVIHAEVPGVKKEDIRVDVDGNQVSISAQAQRESEEKSENMLCTERSWGQYYRSFTLPQAVDDAQATAEYHDGILALTLPKKAGGTAKTLAIH
jgi:HSP20 family protein